MRQVEKKKSSKGVNFEDLFMSRGVKEFLKEGFFSWLVKGSHSILM